MPRHHGHKQYRNMTRDEAEYIMDEARAKDYWQVDNVYDNREDLQSAIDTLYNSIQGNCYEVTYQENQNGRRLGIFCGACNKDLTSYDPFLTHENGKPHKKTRQQHLTVQDPNIKATLERRPHNEPRRIFPEGSLEEQIDSTEYTVLGVQFVYKETIKGTDVFTCQLCQRDTDCTRISQSKMFNHLTSKSHTRKYMEVKFGYVKKAIADFEAEAKGIEEHEGKIHHTIIDFTKQLPFDLREEYMPRSPSPSRSKRSESKSRRRKSRSRSSDRYSTSRSKNRRTRSRSRTWSRSPSPSSSRNRHSRSLSSPSSASDSDRSDDFLSAVAAPPPVAPPPAPLLPPAPTMIDTAIQVDMTEEPKHILDEVNILTQEEAKEALMEDTDMQMLLIQSLWILNLKLEKYYTRTGGTYQGPGDEVPVRLRDSAKKVKEYIMKLTDIPNTEE